MKKKIVILGSTGSIGKTTLEVIRKDKKNFDIILLSARKNINELLKQSKEFNAKNLVITNKFFYLKVKKKLLKSKIKVFNNYESFVKKNKFKIDYTMSSIIGLDGLKPTLDAIKYSKKIAIANKESIICAWSIIQKKLKKYKTEFIPVDSEHFSIWMLLDNSLNDRVEKLIITASGGPFLRIPFNKFKYINHKEAIKHPNWKMGKKISIDSATMMNKVFEVIEAQRIFNIDIKKIDIFVHSKSYVHSIIKLSNGLIKILAHDTNMKIPIFNTIYENRDKKNIDSKPINLSVLNNLNLEKINLKRFPVVKLLKKISNNCSLLETVLVSINDELVNLFLMKKIEFTDISKNLIILSNLKVFNKYKNIQPSNFKEIAKISNFARLKTRSMYI